MSKQKPGHRPGDIDARPDPEARVYHDQVKPFFKSLENTFSPIFPFNMAKNYQYLMELMNERDYNPKLKKPTTAGPAIVIASGPSLDVAIPYLNEARKTHKAKIWCGPTQLWALHYNGVTPDYVVQHDPWYRRCHHDGCDSMVDVTPQSEIECMREGHVQVGEGKEDILHHMYLCQWAPPLEKTIMYAHPGVAPEALRWPSFRDHGKMYFTLTNPMITVGEGKDRKGSFMRDFQRAQYVSNGIEKYVVATGPQRIRMTEHEWIQGLRELGNHMYEVPNRYERADSITDMMATLYGQGNPQLRYPVKVAVTMAPSTSQACAYLAWLHGHDPIYFVGYDLCMWRERRRHTPHYFDGSTKQLTPAPTEGFRGSSLFITDEIQLGEKTILLAYLSKVFKGSYAMPGFRCVEVVCDNTPGQLELLPRIGLDEFARGGSRKVSQAQTGAKIREVMSKRVQML